ncbi:MAG: aldehyde dehydrogenase family protein, partial [Bacteroidota bacterium]
MSQRRFESINPWTLETLKHWPEMTDNELERRIRRASDASGAWRRTGVGQRTEPVLELADRLEVHKEDLARIATLEMGKPLRESMAEIEKCQWLCRYYAEEAPNQLAVESIQTDADRSEVRNDPLGPILGIMPWNYPYWQVFRFAIPTLLAGNPVLLKHAPNVFGVSEWIERLFTEAGFSDGLYQHLVVHHDRVERILSDPVVRGVSLTGSTRAGRSVAALAGQYLKPSLLELGGSNAMLILSDAEPERAAEIARNARMQNNGQSCIAAKRLIIEKSVADSFLEALHTGVESMTLGDPMDSSTDTGPLARVDLAEELERQIRSSVSAGARLMVGGDREEARIRPAILTGVQPGMAAFDEETFGPLAAVTVVRDEEEAFRLAGKTTYGLGLSILTKD